MGKAVKSVRGRISGKEINDVPLQSEKLSGDHGETDKVTGRWNG
jgi:hypothetical protein